MPTTRCGSGSVWPARFSKSSSHIGEQQLAGAPSSLDLPTDRPRPPVQTSVAALQSAVVLPKELLDSPAGNSSRHEGATLFMTLLAAFQILLSRYTGQEDVVVGSPIARRNRAEVERLIGFFVNTLVLRTDLSGDPSFRELLGRVREPRWAPTPTRTCRSRSWSRSCTRSVT